MRRRKQPDLKANFLNQVAKHTIERRENLIRNLAHQIRTADNSQPQDDVSGPVTDKQDID